MNLSWKLPAATFVFPFFLLGCLFLVSVISGPIYQNVHLGLCLYLLPAVAKQLEIPCISSLCTPPSPPHLLLTHQVSRPLSLSHWNSPSPWTQLPCSGNHLPYLLKHLEPITALPSVSQGPVFLMFSKCSENNPQSLFCLIPHSEDSPASSRECFCSESCTWQLAWEVAIVG